MKKLLTIAAVLLAVMMTGCQEKPDEGSMERLQTPMGIGLHGSTETTLTFQWSVVAEATSYSWKLTEVANGAQKTGSTTNRNVRIDKLKKATEYSFSVRAEAKNRESGWSKEITATTKGTATDPTAERICVDAPLALELDAAPTLGTSGLVKVFKADGTEVDRIDLADISKVTVREDGVMVPAQGVNAGTFMDKVTSGGRDRSVHYTPFRVSGRKLIIKPHCMALDFDTEYYITVDESVCGKAVAAGDWKFTTKTAPSSAAAIRVAADGSGDFCTLQRALTYVEDGSTVTLANGTYEGLLYLREKKNVTVKGDSRDGVRIAYPNNESYMSGSSARCLWLVENCDNLALQDLTVENTFGQLKGQAECIYFNSGNNTHRLTIERCTLLSYQDTFLCKGEVWVHDSLIAGHCDFIWGYPKACMFEGCEIRARDAGYIVQARVPQADFKGFVFYMCSLTCEDGVKDESVYLARSGGDSSVYDNVVFVKCTMGPFVNKAGWLGSPAPNPSVPTATAGWREFGSVDNAEKPVTGSRSAFGRVLTAAEAEPYSSRAAVLGW